jgi:hypothetical protein
MRAEFCARATDRAGSNDRTVWHHRAPAAAVRNSDIGLSQIAERLQGYEKALNISLSGSTQGGTDTGLPCAAAVPVMATWQKPPGFAVPLEHDRFKLA